MRLISRRRDEAICDGFQSCDDRARARSDVDEAAKSDLHVFAHQGVHGV